MMKPFDANADGQPAPANATPDTGRNGRKRRGRPPTGTPDWKPRFLRFLRLWNGPVRAARKAGVHPATAYKARESDPAFRDAWEEALELRKEWLDLQILKRGLAGSDRCLLAHARAHIPERYGKKDPKPATAVKGVSIIKVMLPSPKPPEPAPMLIGEPVRDLPAEGGGTDAGPPPAPEPPRTPVKRITFITAPRPEPPRQEPEGG